MIDSDTQAAIREFQKDNDLTVTLRRAHDGEAARRNSRYESRRIHSNAAASEPVASCRPTGAAYYAAPGELRSLANRAILPLQRAQPGRIVYGGDIHHSPYSLQPAEAELSKNTMTRQIAIDLPSQKPTYHFGRYQEVVAWPIRKY
jgi:uncharacterized protein